MDNVHLPEVWPAYVISRFAVVTEEEIFQMQDNAIPNNAKKATKLGMKVRR